MQVWIYILASKPYGTLYVGQTESLAKRIWEHKNNVVQGFTQKYNVHDLVYFEGPYDFEEGLKREHRLKRWKRDWKIKIIEEKNPQWLDLYETIL